MDHFEKMNQHIEEIAKEYIKNNSLDTKGIKVVQEFNELEVKAKEDDRDGIKIAGYLSTFKNADRENDVVKEDAFKKTIRGLKKLPMLRDHRNETDYQIGSWNKFKVDNKGLYVEGFISRTEKTEHLIRLIEDGHLNTLSMGGLFRYADKPDKKGRFVIEEVMLLEGSVVSIPANPKATFTQKSLGGEKAEQVSDENAKQVSKLKKLLNDNELKESQKKAIQELINELEETKNES